jgi:hypothetical protein
MENSPAAQNDRAETRVLEPYCYGQFTEGKASPNFGRSHVHWLTGTASTVMVGCVEGILGMRPDFRGLHIEPSIPEKWEKFEITKSFRNEYITGDRKAEVLFGSKIVLNNFHYAEINSANVKFFEINGIGAFQLCDYKPVLEEYSAVDVEKFTYKTIDEAIEKIKYFLDQPLLRYGACENVHIAF